MMTRSVSLEERNNLLA